MKRFIILVISAIFFVSCAILMHDSSNPCNKKGSNYNSKECENWQQKHPKEYERYKKRLKKSNE